MQIASIYDIPIPNHEVVTSYSELETVARRLGYPDRPVDVKPPISRGMRGFRIFDTHHTQTKAFWEEKPDGIYSRLEDMQFLGDSCPGLIVMDYLSNKEYTVDVLASTGAVSGVIPRSRDKTKLGMSFMAIAHPVPELIKYATLLTEKLQLSYAFGFQFKKDKDGVHRLLECNPRIQGGMILSKFSGVNMIYFVDSHTICQHVDSRSDIQSN